MIIVNTANNSGSDLCHVVPVEAVHHLQLSPEVLLGEVIEHAGVHQGLHKVGAVLRQTQAGQPLVTNPLVVHVAVRQRLRTEKNGLSSVCDENTKRKKNTSFITFYTRTGIINTLLLKSGSRKTFGENVKTKVANFLKSSVHVLLLQDDMIHFILWLVELRRTTLYMFA